MYLPSTSYTGCYGRTTSANVSGQASQLQDSAIAYRAHQIGMTGQIRSAHAAQQGPSTTMNSGAGTSTAGSSERTEGAFHQPANNHATNNTESVSEMAIIPANPASTPWHTSTSNTQADETAADTEVNDETDDEAQGDVEDGQSEIMTYAKFHGFAVNTEYHRKIKKTNEYSRGEMRCYKARRNKKGKGVAPVVSERKRGIIVKTECPVRCKLNVDGARWVVTEYFDEHTHELIKKFDLVKFLTAHRGFTPLEKKFIKLLHDCNVGPSRMVQILSLIHSKNGTLSSMPYIPADVTNLKAKYRRESRLADIEDTIGYFDEKVKEDPDFFYRIRLDDEDRVRNMWHIIKKAKETLGPFFADRPDLHKAFELCVDHSLTVEEFEWSWMAMIETYQVQDNETLASLWEKRMYWVPVYFMHCFFPFLQTTQRSEGFNAVLKRYILGRNKACQHVHGLPGGRTYIQVLVVHDERPESTMEAVRHVVLTKNYAELIDEACKSDETARVAEKHRKALKRELDEIKKRKVEEALHRFPCTSSVPSSTEPSSENSEVGSGTASTQTQVRNPPRSISKGRPKEIRYKSGLEIQEKHKKTKKVTGNQ
ncbi:hypothetical protein VPH35_096697 [Triticum aestivum]